MKKEKFESIDDVLLYCKENEAQARLESGVYLSRDVINKTENVTGSDVVAVYNDITGLVNYWLDFFNEKGVAVNVKDFVSYFAGGPEPLLFNQKKDYNDNPYYFQGIKFVGMTATGLAPCYKIVLKPTSAGQKDVVKKVDACFKHLSKRIGLAQVFRTNIKETTRFKRALVAQKAVADISARFAVGINNKELVATETIDNAIADAKKRALKNYKVLKLYFENNDVPDLVWIGVVWVPILTATTSLLQSVIGD